LEKQLNIERAEFVKSHKSLMRDYLLIFIMVVNLPIGIISPFYGVLVYAWVSYAYPQFWVWSFAQSFPVAKLAAFSVVGGALINRSGDLTPLRDRANITMVLLWCMFTLSTTFAVYPKLAWPYWQDVSKLIVMALMSSILITDRRRLKYLLLVIALSLGFYGLMEAYSALRQAESRWCGDREHP